MQELRNAELKEKRAEVTAHTLCVEEPCSVELNKEPEDETTEQPHDPFPDTDNGKGCHFKVTTCYAESQTTLTMEDIEKQAQVMELNQLRLQLVNVQISEQAFRENNEKTKFYTGIANFVLLTHVFNLVGKHVKHRCYPAVS